MTHARPLIATLLVAFAAAGCGGAAPGAPITPASDDGSGPLTVVIVDVSSSTGPLRAPGGSWERAWQDAAAATAAHEGTLWSASADGDAVGRSAWSVEGHAFRATIADNRLLADAELRRQAKQLAPVGRELMARRGRGGSDLLGALRLAARLFRDYPDRPRRLVLLTDGGITGDGVNLIGRAPNTRRGREQLLRRLQADGRLPDLSGGAGKPPRVWIGGLGHDADGRLTPEGGRQLIAFWEAMIPAAGAELVSADSAALRLVRFP